MSQPTIALVDYGMGNRRSVQKALERVGARVLVTSDGDEILGASGVVVPGVGAFPRAMESLGRLGLVSVLRSLASEGVPMLGICLGMQLLFDGSPELEYTEGLGLIAGDVTELASGGLRIPHIGWSEVAFTQPSRLTEGLPAAGCPFYHVHSLVPRPADAADVVGTAEYGERFATIVERGLIFGVQFHPEKSSAHGLRLLENFVEVCVRHAGPVEGARARA